VLDGDEILQRLRHLLAMDVQMTRMQEIVDPLIALVVGFALSYLVVMVGETKIYTT
jgi:hypothetical protein